MESDWFRFVVPSTLNLTSFPIRPLESLVFPLQAPSSLSQSLEISDVATKRKGEKKRSTTSWFNINTLAWVRQKNFSFHFSFECGKRSEAKKKNISKKMRGAWVVVMVWSAGERIALWILYFNEKSKLAEEKKYSLWSIITIEETHLLYKS